MKKTVCILLAALTLLSLCGCGASNDAVASEPAEFSYEVAYEESYDAAAVEERGYGLSASNSAVVAGEGSAESVDAPEVDPAKIIYSADATVETTEFDNTLTQVAEMVDSFNGWIESSSVNGANYYNTARGNVSSRAAHYTLRIPSSRFEALMSSLSKLGNVPYTYTYTENVTTQYYDTQARLTAYQTQETRLLEMMELAESVEDVITIEEKLTELRYQIEALQSRLNNWDREVSYSTVNLSIDEVQVYTPESTGKARLSYPERLWNALKSGLKSIGLFFSDLLLWLVEALPSLVVLGAVIYAAVKLIKRSRAKRKAKKDAQNGESN